MSIEYRVLTQEAMDEITVDFMEAQERDKFCHELNLERYKKILKSASGGWKARIQTLHDETVQRLKEVNDIIESSGNQLPPKERIDAAKERLAARRTTK